MPIARSPRSFLPLLRGLRASGRCALLLLALHQGLAQSDIKPPFNLAWGKPAIELEEALLGGSGRIVERKRIAGGGESWQVEGLPQPALQRAVFHLPKHQLAAVELQYGKEDWAPENYDALMQSVKGALEAKHGPGVLIARRQDTARGVLQTLLGYRWENASGAVELVYFAAQNPENLYRTVSLHYTAPGPAAPAPATAAPTSTSSKNLNDPPLPPLPEK
jgi:hypothetical protein